MNNSEIRKHLRKGELAVALAESLGYTFGTDPENANREVWNAPPATPEDAALKALRELIESREVAAVNAFKESQKTNPNGPNWHLVEGMQGRLFRVRPENIPVGHPLRDYGKIHFERNYRADEIRYVRSPAYTGYSVGFKFQKFPYALHETVWLPLSCAAFASA